MHVVHEEVDAGLLGGLRRHDQADRTLDGVHVRAEEELDGDRSEAGGQAAVEVAALESRVSPKHVVELVDSDVSADGGNSNSNVNMPLQIGSEARASVEMQAKEPFSIAHTQHMRSSFLQKQ